ncbi:hypothetical protein K466DRAFT_3524 [Polyporus arcularius HHB13444]|uniref:Uncharacterized protein n=1 Tax=Polyporus arcularius HHB13444 TaxID=1314778 RepID=A0A5C3Q1M8_9APHY|nr:hypothetical protein K466DRAFT_3524 [Polyporus arcularius HHB13444]
MGAAFFGPGRGRTHQEKCSAARRSTYALRTGRVLIGPHSKVTSFICHGRNLSLNVFLVGDSECSRRLVRSLATCRAQPAALRPIQASATFWEGQYVLDRMQCLRTQYRCSVIVRLKGRLAGSASIVSSLNQPAASNFPAGTTSARQTMHGLPHGRRRQVSPPDASNLFQSGHRASCALPGRAQSLYCILTTVVSTGHTAQREDRVHLFSEDGYLVPLGKLWAIQQADAQGLCFPVDISLNSPLVRSSRCCPVGDAGVPRGRSDGAKDQDTFRKPSG